MNPLAFSSRSSPRTSALAAGKRETALGSQPCGHRAHTYTHTPFFRRQGITWTNLSPFPGFPFGHPNPKYPPPDHQGGVGSKTIGRKPITHTKVLFSTFFFVCCVPPTYHTHKCIRFLFHSCYHDCPLRSWYTCVCVFSNSPFRIHGATELRTPHLNTSDLFSFDSPALL